MLSCLYTVFSIASGSKSSSLESTHLLRAFTASLCPRHEKRRLEVLHALLEEVPADQPRGSLKIF